MQLEERGGVLVLRFTSLLRFPQLEHFFVTRRTPYDVCTESGREAIARLFGTGPIFVPSQVHGADFLVFEEKLWYNASCRMVDALLAGKKNQYLGILVADCVPLLLFAPEQEVVALVHAGWRGVARGIHIRVVEAMERLFSASPSAIWAGVGPAIGPCCFEVGEDVLGALGREREAFVERRAGRTFVDLKGIVAEDLLARGLLREHLEVSSLCTCCEEDLLCSFRRDRSAARCLLVAGMRG